MVVRLVQTVEIVPIVQAAGFDAFYIDLDHSSISVETAGQICIAALQSKVTPLVRMPAGRLDLIGHLLNGGAMGLIAPHIETAEEARKIVAMAKFPPVGLRTSPGAMPHLNYGRFPVQETYDAMNELTLVAVMVESVEALDQVEAIADVDGVDMILIGSGDLTESMGIPGKFDDPRLRDAFARTVAACQANGKAVGMAGLSTWPEVMKDFVGLGVRFASAGTDMTYLLRESAARAKALRSIQPPVG
jgi:2-keto-3-deoxy-L-rhamnonate aldolase RhmA